MIEILLVALIFLIILSFLDIKTFNLKEGYIPSVLTTSFMIVALILTGTSGLLPGVLAFLMGLLFIDLDMFQGLADWKILVACGITLPGIVHVAIFGGFITALSIVYKLLLSKTKFKDKEIPFIPVLLVAYIGIIGVILL